ncbi:hypothetical protein KC921_03680 [Candidatus Woesebacteria bacterium]|nr:hypothetical protein [Candidatus Woesebacteria bacterium]
MEHERSEFAQFDLSKITALRVVTKGSRDACALEEIVHKSGIETVLDIHSEQLPAGSDFGSVFEAGVVAKLKPQSIESHRPILVLRRDESITVQLDTYYTDLVGRNTPLIVILQGISVTEGTAFDFIAKLLPNVRFKVFADAPNRDQKRQLAAENTIPIPESDLIPKWVARDNAEISGAEDVLNVGEVNADDSQTETWLEAEEKRELARLLKLLESQMTLQEKMQILHQIRKLCPSMAYYREENTFTQLRDVPRTNNNTFSLDSLKNFLFSQGYFE